MQHTVADFSIQHWAWLSPEGGLEEAERPWFTQAPENMVEMYRAMLRTRLFDSKAIHLQRTGQLGTYASPLGQEAIGVGAGFAMRDEDLLVPAYRDQAAQLLRGVTMKDILLYWGGDERGMDFKSCREDFPMSVPVASQCYHAVGIAYAFKLRKAPRVVVCTLGDGATSKGDFYESMNAAGVWRLPVVFIVNNNQWAISVPRSTQSAATTLAQKAIAAGIQGEQVDGNDVVAVRARVEAALEGAREGQGPVLVEALTYRMGDHTTADDASRYRQQSEVESYTRLDPLSRLRKWLFNSGFWSDQQDDAQKRELNEEVEEAVNAYLATAPQRPESMFDYLYKTLPEGYREQRDEVVLGLEQREPGSQSTDGSYDH